jgi:hypothetical protein
MDDLLLVLEVGGGLLAAMATVIALVWASRRGVDAFAVVVGLAILSIVAGEGTGHLVRDEWTTARISLGLVFVVLGVTARWDPARETARTLLKIIAAVGVAAACAAIYGPHPARAMAVGLALLVYLTSQGEAAVAAAFTGALSLSLGLAKGLRLVPPQELGSDLFGAVALMALAACAWRDGRGVMLRRLSALVIVVMLVSAFWHSGFGGHVPRAENAATTFACVFAAGAPREARRRRRPAESATD